MFGGVVSTAGGRGLAKKNKKNVWKMQPRSQHKWLGINYLTIRIRNVAQMCLGKHLSKISTAFCRSIL